MGHIKRLLPRQSYRTGIVPSDDILLDVFGIYSGTAIKRVIFQIISTKDREASDSHNSNYSFDIPRDIWDQLAARVIIQ